MMATMQIRRAGATDRPFLVEMARVACTLEERTLLARDDPEVLGVLPAPSDAAVVATDDDGRLIGGAWWHMHEPPLLRDAEGRPVPEIAMAVVESDRRQGVGTALVDALAQEAVGRSSARWR